MFDLKKYSELCLVLYPGLRIKDKIKIQPMYDISPNISEDQGCAGAACLK